MCGAGPERSQRGWQSGRGLVGERCAQLPQVGFTQMAYGAPAFRIAAFYDAGWAGAKHDWQKPGRPMSGAGLGFSMLDGLIRLDIARGIFPSSMLKPSPAPLMGRPGFCHSCFAPAHPAS